MREQMTEKELLARLDALPREIVPDNDAWPVISRRIEQGRATGSGSINRWWFRALAASFVLAIAAGLLLGRQWSSDPGPAQTGFSLAARSQLVQATGLSGTLAATELEYQAAFREFISIGEPDHFLSLKTLEKLTEGWDHLRESEAGLRIALQQFPDSFFLNERMLELRSRQLKFLQQIAALDRNSRRAMI